MSIYSTVGAHFKAIEKLEPALMSIYYIVLCIKDINNKKRDKDKFASLSMAVLH